MDPFTEKLLERTRARRENLQKKMAERPTAASRQISKRTREPLTETNTLTERPTEEVQASTKPSPSKRRCSDNKEVPATGEENRQPVSPDSMLKPLEMDKKPPIPLVSNTLQPALSSEKEGVELNTPIPAGISLKSRMHKLAEKRQCWDNNDAVLDADVSPIKTQSQKASLPIQSPMSVSSEPPLGRKGRFANLAATIGSWEDDLSHPSVKPNNAQVQPGTTCLSKPSATNGASAGVSSNRATPNTASYSQKTAEASVNKPVLSAQQSSINFSGQSTRVVSSSPQKTEKAEAPSALRAGRAVPSSPQRVNQSSTQLTLQAGRSITSSSQKSNLPPQQAALPSGRVISSSPQKKDLGRLHSPSPQKAQLPKEHLAFQAGKPALSNLKQTEATSLLTKATLSLQTREQFTKEYTVQQKSPAVTPGGSGVKSFLERFGERCQERSNKSPASGTQALGTSTVTPNTKLVQDRLKSPQLSTATADLTQKQKQEREKELALIRNRFQKGNMWKSDNETSHTKELQNKETTDGHSDQLVPQTECKLASLPVKVNDSNHSSLKPSVSSSVGFLKKDAVVSNSKSSPLKKVAFSVNERDTSESLEDQKVEEDAHTLEVVREVEMAVDEEVNSSGVIDELFDGVVEEPEEPARQDPEVKRSKNEQLEGPDEIDETGGDEDPLNISSMSLLTPLAETVASTVTSPEMYTPTSTVNESNNTPDGQRATRFQRARVRRAESIDSIDSVADDYNLLYSIDAYRSTRVKEADRPHVKQVIVRKEDVSRKQDNGRDAGQVNIKQKIKIFNNEINMQQTVIHQASQALNCCVDEDHGKGSQVEAEAERLLLIATERRLAFMKELNRLKGEGPSGQKKGPSTSKAHDGSPSASTGSVSLFELRLPLKADFVCSLTKKPESANYYFFLMVRAGAENTVATPLTSTQNALSGDALTFPTKFTLPDVSNDFEIDVEVYCLVQKQEIPSDKRKKTSKAKGITPKRLLTSITKSNLHTPVMASPGGPNAVRTSNFVLVGAHKLTLASIGKNKFTLDQVPFLCPLEGHIYLKLQCQVGSSIEERGFLTMFEDVSGFGAWHRRWCVLSGYCISYWTYPDDEKRKNPIGRINLANCTSRRIEPANREFCARPNTFELVTVRPQQEEDKETLVSQCRNTLCVTKNWLSADTKDERNLWMQTLNQVLVDLRMWQPDSCYRPV
ncbi:anillin isoform X2 [Amia ocellicauda]|uniref:anillin isoform X2 n=1 Tax=Amia ocellicauda TaxID=2972642 RepID=UPI003464E2B6